MPSSPENRGTAIIVLCKPYSISVFLKDSNLAHTVAGKENNEISAFANVFNLYILKTAKPAKCFLNPVYMCLV